MTAFPSIEKLDTLDQGLAKQALAMIRVCADHCVDLATQSHAKALRLGLGTVGWFCNTAGNTIEFLTHFPDEPASAEPLASQADEPRNAHPSRPRICWRPGE